ncbi:MAG: hypothetical protein ACREF6_02490 [Alphaproteobacteria bacterium]
MKEDLLVMKCTHSHVHGRPRRKSCFAYVERFVETSGAVRAIVVAQTGAGVLATSGVSRTLALESDEP